LFSTSDSGKALTLEDTQAAVTIRFPWWDSLGEARKFLQWLRSAESGADFCDLDQGWRFDAVRLGDWFHFLESDFDDGHVFANVMVDRGLFLKALDAAEAAI
jgi:hypothetical protein